MFHYLNSVLITHFHDQHIAQNDSTPSTDTEDDVWEWIELNHLYNAKLWNEEEHARRLNVPAEGIARSKRLIDGYNQARDDSVEAIDEKLLDELRDYPPQQGARLSSETPGAMIDRLSILSLKIYHMNIQTQRFDVDDSHRDTCSAKLRRLMEQRRDLAGCLDLLLRELGEGKACFKVYRQFTIYNDPRQNSYLYADRARPRVREVERRQGPPGG